MFSSIRIDGYRGFEHFEMSGLGRVNLLVGTNNSGKTSVLEAIYLLASLGDPKSIWDLLWRRGERLPATITERPRSRFSAELDIAHLFSGHELRPGSAFSIRSQNDSRNRWIEFKAREVSLREQADLFASDKEAGIDSGLALEVHGNPRPDITMIPLTRAGGLHGELVGTSVRRVLLRAAESASAHFISTGSLDSDELISMWDKIALTPREGLVLRALQFLDSDIERIAAQSAVGSVYGGQTRGGFIVKRKGSDQPVPIGSMGDGMWRMLAMAIAITQCKGGVLLVDEIDTGLHYTAMSQMWTLIYNAAEELDVQVFATTHSYDCVYSLAQICGTGNMKPSITVQRVEAHKQKSVPYDEDEIAVAADRDIEVR
jgi:hypothetical protein